MACFIIAEAGVNHNGSEAVALELVDAAAAAGADAVKFQTFRAETLVAPGTETAAYQRQATGVRDQQELLRRLELADGAYGRLAQRCRMKGVEFLSTPFDEGSADLLVNVGMARLKVPSGELTNHPFLRHLVGLDLPILLSTGMSTLEEVRSAVEVVEEERRRRGMTAPLDERLTLLHCVSSYPTALNDANLLALRTLATEFMVPVGYSDHTAGVLAAVTAVALGAVVVEKHFTLDRHLPGPDHAASLNPGEFDRMVSDIRDVELVLGDGRKAPRSSEESLRRLVRRSLVTSQELAQGTILMPHHVVRLRPGIGIPPSELEAVLGHRTRRALSAGHVLQWDDLTP